MISQEVERDALLAQHAADRFHDECGVFGVYGSSR